MREWRSDDKFWGWEPSFHHVILRMEFRSSGLVGDTFTWCGPPSRLAAPHPSSFLGFCCLNLYSPKSFLCHSPSFLPAPPLQLGYPGLFTQPYRIPDVAFLQPGTHTTALQKAGTLASYIYWVFRTLCSWNGPTQDPISRGTSIAAPLALVGSGGEMSGSTAVVFTPSKDHLFRLLLKFGGTGVFQSVRSLGIVFRHF